MTQTSPSKMNIYDYQFLTGKWQGTKGAAYNQTYEFCKEFGWCRQDGSLTEAGEKAVKDFENVTYDLSV